MAKKSKKVAARRSSAPSARVDSVGMAVLAYIIFLVPLLVARNSKFAMYHTNQGLLLFIFAMVVNLIGGIIPVLGWFIIAPFGNIVIIIFAIMGIINAAGGKMKPLPLIGNYTLIS